MNYRNWQRLLLIVFLSVLSREAQGKKFIKCVQAGICSPETCVALGSAKGAACASTPGCAKCALKPKECKIRATRIGACIAARVAYQQCFPATDPDYPGHMKEIEELVVSEGKCLACAGLPQVAMCCAKGLGKILGPIGVAITVGEIGACAIDEYGEYCADQIEQEFACLHRDKVRRLKDAACAKWHAAKDAFESKYCPIEVEVEYGSCGPKKIKKFAPDRDCNLIQSCDTEEAEKLFSDAASSFKYCQSMIRLYTEYDKLCDGRPGCER